jgi:hypothetical protein
MSGHARLFAHGNAIHAPSLRCPALHQFAFGQGFSRRLCLFVEGTLGHHSAATELARGDEFCPRGARMRSIGKPKLGRDNR